MRLGVPLLHDAQAHGAGADFAAEVHVAVKVTGVGIVQRVGVVVMAERLVIGGDLLPAVGRGDVHGRAGGAGEDVHLGDRAVDFLEREAAHGLRLFPFERINGGFGGAERLGALRVPRAVGGDLAAVHAHGGGGEKILETAVQHFHTLDAAHPEIAVGVGEIALGLLRICVGEVE